MSELKPGEYVGADGHTYGWMPTEHPGIVHCAADGEWAGCAVAIKEPDIPAAAEALKALVPEPFEWEITDRDWPRRWNGVRVERYDEVRDMWLDTGSEETVAFEQGRRYERERGHADE